MPGIDGPEEPEVLCGGVEVEVVVGCCCGGVAVGVGVVTGGGVW